MAGPMQRNHFLPPFADDSNKQLDGIITQLEVSLEATDVSTEEHRDRLGVMQEHLGNVQQELQYTQSRLSAKGKELESEGHLQQLAKREGSRLNKDVEHLNATQRQLTDKLDLLHSELYRGNEKLDQFKLVMNWNQEEFQQWALAARQKEEDNLVLEQYQRQDEARIRELTMQLEKLSQEVQAARRAVADEVTETQAAQIELDTTAEGFKQLHHERQALLVQWEDAVNGMHRRDQAIQAATERFAARKGELRELRAALDGQGKFLAQEEASNREVEARIQLQEREVARLREAHAAEQHALTEAQDETGLLRATAAKAKEELAVQTSTNAMARAAIEQKRKALAAVQQKQAGMQERLKGELGALDTLEAKVQHLEGLRKAEVERLAAVSKELRNLKAQQVKRGQELYSLRSSEKEMISEIAGGQAQARNVADRVRKLDEKVVVQQEMLYNVEFQLQMMERKVARAGGERSDEEMKALNAKIARLTEQLQGVNAEYGMLTAQVKRSEEDLGHLRRHNLDQRRSQTRLEDEITAIQLEAELTARSLRTVVSAKEERMVESDVLALEVRRLRAGLAAAAEQVAALENRRVQLRFSMEERKGEIEVHREALAAELKALQEDLHRVALELTERQQRVSTLRSKFEVASATARGEDGEEHSQAFFVIRAAQEREELQRTGNDLDARIKTAEKETAGLQATLAGLAGTNMSLSTSFRRVNTHEAHAERAALRQQLDRAYDVLKFKRNEERALAQDVAVAESRLDNLAGEEQQLQSAVQQLQSQQAAVQRQVTDQEEKHGRATQRVQRLRRSFRSKQAGEGSLEEQDVQLLLLQEANSQMLRELASAVAEHQHSADLLEQIQGRGIRLPGSVPPPGSARSSRSGLSPASSQRSITSLPVPQQSMVSVA